MAWIADDIEQWRAVLRGNHVEISPMAQGAFLSALDRIELMSSRIAAICNLCDTVIAGTPMTISGEDDMAHAVLDMLRGVPIESADLAGRFASLQMQAQVKGRVGDKAGHYVSLILCTAADIMRGVADD